MSAQRIAELEAEVEELRARVSQLQDLLHGTIQFPRKFGLNNKETKVLNLLMMHTRVREELFYDALYWHDRNGGPSREIIKVYISRIRKLLNFLNVRIHFTSQGYELTPESRRVILEEVCKFEDMSGVSRARLECTRSSAGVVDHFDGTGDRATG